MRGTKAYMRISIKLSINIVLSAALLFVSTGTSLAQGQNAEEKKILEYIDSHSDEAIALLERLVNIES